MFQQLAHPEISSKTVRYMDSIIVINESAKWIAVIQSLTLYEYKTIEGV